MNGDIFNKKYVKFKNNCISNFSSQIVDYSDYNNKSVKSSLCNIIKVELWEKKHKVITIRRSDFYNNLCVEIIGFNNRAQEQLNNIRKMENIDLSWGYVTEYYFIFFLITLFSRLNQQFVTYIDSSEAMLLSKNAEEIFGQKIVIGGGNYLIKVIEDNEINDSITISLDNKNDTHKANWDNFALLLQRYREIDKDVSSYEDLVIQSLKSIFNKFGDTYLSDCRNVINYRYYYGFEIKDFPFNSRPLLNKDLEDVAKTILSFDTNNNSFENKLFSSGYVTAFLYHLTQKLYEEFEQIIIIEKS